MPRKRKEPELNLNFTRDALITTLQVKYHQYKNAVKENLDLCGFDSNGNIWVYAGGVERNKRINDLAFEITKALDDLHRINKLIEEEKSAKKVL